jgi:hypothetical protein
MIFGSANGFVIIWKLVWFWINVSSNLCRRQAYVLFLERYRHTLFGKLWYHHKSVWFQFQGNIDVCLNLSEIGYANICSSVQDHRLKFNKVWTYIRASEAQEKLKYYGRRSKERSTRSQRFESEERMLLRSWRSTSDCEDLQTLKNIRSWGAQTPRQICPLL